jgi:hypothetical protein
VLDDSPLPRTRVRIGTFDELALLDTGAQWSVMGGEMAESVQPLAEPLHQRVRMSTRLQSSCHHEIMRDRSLSLGAPRNTPMGSDPSSQSSVMPTATSGSPSSRISSASDRAD